MSRTIDERIVAMQFENQQFEKGAKETIKTLEDLKKNLNFEDVGDSFEKVSKLTEKGFGLKDTTRQTNLFTKSIQGLGRVAAIPFQTLASGFNQLNGYLRTYLGYDLAGQLVNTGKQILRTFTIDPMRTGWNEYELKMDSIKTIMTGTQGEYKKILGAEYSEEAHLDIVKEKLEDLNKYADDTIYSFSDMTSNIGKFTNNGVALDKAVSSMKGIANAAAQAGQGTNQASMAMYNLSQAIGVGKLTTIDWKSIEYANIATLEFKESFIEVGLAMGKLKKVQDKIFAVDEKGNVNKKMEVTAENFRNTLSAGWATSDVIVATLAAYSGDYTLEELSEMVKDQKVAAELLKIGQQAKKAATEVRTFSKMFDALKEAAQSGWAISWELIFGDMKEGSTFWTHLNERFSAMLDAASEKRNDLLRGWRGEVMNADRDQMVSVIQGWFESEETGFADEYGMKKWFGTESGVPKMVKEILDHFQKEGTSVQAVNKLVSYLNKEYGVKEDDARKIISRVAEDYHNLDYIGKDGREDLIKGIDNILDAFGNLKEVYTSLKTSIYGETTASGLQMLTEGFANVTGKIKDFTAAIKNGKTFDALKNIFSGLASVFNAVYGSVKNLGSLLMTVLGPVGDFVLGIFSKVGEWLTKVSGETISKTIGNIAAKLKTLTGVKIGAWFSKTGKSIGTFFKTIGTTTINWLTNNGYTAVANALIKGWESIKNAWTKVKSWTGWATVGEFFTSIWSWITKQYGKIKKAFSKGENGEPSEVSKWLTNAKNVISEAWNSIVEWPGWKTVGSFIGGIWNWIKSTYSTVISWFKPDENEEASIIATWITEAYNKISDAWDSIKELPIWTTLGQFFGNLWGWITSKFSGGESNKTPINKNPNKNLFEFFDDVEESSKHENDISAFSQTIINIGSIIDNAREVLSTAWSTFMGWFTSISGDLGSFLSGVWEWIKSKATIVYTAFIPGENGEASAISQWITSAYDKISVAWSTFMGWFTPIAGNIGSFLTGVWEWIREKATTVYTAFIPGENGEASAVSKWITDAYDFISKAWADFMAWFTPIAGNIGSFLTGVWEWIREKATTVYTAFMPGENGEASAVSKWITDAYDFISVAWANFMAWFTPIAGNIGSFLTGVYGWIKDKATTVYAAFKPSKNGEASAISRFINDAYKSIKKVWDKVYNWDGWRMIGLFLSDLWGFILNPTFISSANAEDSMDYEGQANAIIQNVVENIENTSSAIEKEVSKTPHNYVFDDSGLFEEPVESTASLWTRFTEMLKPIGGVVSDILSAVANIASMIVGQGTKLDIVLTAIVDVIKAVADMVTTVFTVLNDLITNAFTSGSEKQVESIIGLIGLVIGFIGTKILDAYTANRKAFLSSNTDRIGTTILKMAISIGIIALAIDLISKIPVDNLWGAVAIVAGLGIIILGITTALSEKWQLTNNNSQINRQDKVAEVFESLFKWAAIFGMIAVVINKIPEILDKMNTGNLDGDVILKLFEGLTMLIGGIILISSLAETKLFAKAHNATNDNELMQTFLSSVAMIGMLAVAMALLPGVIKAIGEANIQDGDAVLRTFEGVTILILGIVGSVAVLAKLKIDAVAMVQAAAGITLGISVALIILVSALLFIGGIMAAATGEKLDKDFAVDGLVNLITGIGKIRDAIRDAFGNGNKVADGKGIGNVTDAIVEAAENAEDINVEDLEKLKKVISLTQDITTLMQKWTSEEVSRMNYNGLEEELVHVSTAMSAFGEACTTMSNSDKIDLGAIQQVNDALVGLMTVANLEQMLQKFSNDNFSWLEFATGLQMITGELGVGATEGIDMLTESFIKLSSFAETVNAAIKDAVPNIDVSPLIGAITEGIVNPDSATQLRIAFAQLGNELAESGTSLLNFGGTSLSGGLAELITGGGFDLSGLFGKIEFGDILGDLNTDNLTSYLNSESFQSIDPSSLFASFDTESIKKTFSGFNADSIKAAFMGENGEGLIDPQTLIGDSDYRDSVYKMITGMQEQLDSGEYSLSVTTVGNWEDLGMLNSDTLTIDGTVTLATSDVSTITSCITTQTNRIVNAIGTLNGRIAGVEQAIAGMSIVLDTGVLAGAINQKLGQQYGNHFRQTYVGG